MHSFQVFFEAGAGVAGGLVGLLFVAISVMPHKMSGEGACTDFQIRAGLCLNALVDAAVLALFGLIPGQALGEAGVVAAILGFSSTIGLGIGPRQKGPLGPAAVPRLAVLLALYVAQLVNSLLLIVSSNSYGFVKVDAMLVVACFLFAIDGAWELLGGSKSRLFFLPQRHEIRKSEEMPVHP
ncbi:MAG: hypothetical protein WAM97_08370 [Acidimicrobiales bacterium]